MRTNWLVMDDVKDPAHAPYRARLAAAGRHLPTTRLTTDELMATTPHNTHIVLDRLTGIHERRVSLGDEDSYTLATAAARNCLETAQLDGSALDVVIHCQGIVRRGLGVSGEYISPLGATPRAISGPS